MGFNSDVVSWSNDTTITNSVWIPYQSAFRGRGIIPYFKHLNIAEQRL
jgi:hypothetical protein